MYHKLKKLLLFGFFLNILRFWLFFNFTDNEKVSVTLFLLTYNEFEIYMKPTTLYFYVIEKVGCLFPTDSRVIHIPHTKLKIPKMLKIGKNLHKTRKKDFQIKSSKTFQFYGRLAHFRDHLAHFDSLYPTTTLSI